MRGGGGSTARDSVGLLDEDDGAPLGEHLVRHRHEVAGADSPRGAVPEDEGASWRIDLMHVSSRLPVGSVDVDGPHVAILPARLHFPLRRE